MTTTATPFTTVHHVCVVVEDIDAAVAYYESIGIGPWQDFGALEFPESTLSPEELATLTYRFCNLNNFQLQLCEPAPGTTLKRRFLEEHGPGVYHIAFSVPEIEEAERSALERGMRIGERCRTANGSGFTYFDTADQAGVVLELRSQWKSD